MDLKTQIMSFIFSFFFGIIIALAYKISYKYLFEVKDKYKMLNSCLFITNITLIYFKIMYLINNGIIHLYFLLTTILTFIITNKNLQKKCQKKHI